MTGLRDRLEELAADTLVYGDVEQAIQRVARRRRRNALVGLGAAVAVVVLALVAGEGAINRDAKDSLQPLAPPPVSGPTGLASRELPTGPLAPGRYRFVVTNTCDHEDVGCPAGPAPQLPALEVTVPEGWEGSPEFVSLFPLRGRDTTSRNDPALALGWTSHWVGLYSQPCRADNAPPPDIPVGPTVDDFVDAVTAHPVLDVTEPKPVTLGRHDGRFFTLTGPSDISDCTEWRPWGPAPYLQGAANTWDVWAMDVDGVRVVIMAEYFPETPAPIKAELRHMAESIRFLPRTS